MVGDEVRIDRQPQQPQAGVQRVLPHGRIPLEQLFAAPDVVHQQVEPLVLLFNPLHQALHLACVQVIDRHGDPVPACRRDQLGRLLDSLGAGVFGLLRAGGAAGDVDGGSGCAQLDGDAAPGPPCGARNQCDLIGEWFRHK